MRAAMMATMEHESAEGKGWRSRSGERKVLGASFRQVTMMSFQESRRTTTAELTAPGDITQELQYGLFER
ncbi:hypothetical protein Dda_3005 [Drechslerella dactyloides]|uniref:Uncharacterized protein n=1 Tax=Drechslerella dactyloides TaxID=74499 RepID=A0AAD6J2V7_DREDA|nr:hypothetical protein Dda_3005 [Drechslerella dactyloides]